MTYKGFTIAGYKDGTESTDTVLIMDRQEAIDTANEWLEQGLADEVEFCDLAEMFK